MSCALVSAKCLASALGSLFAHITNTVLTKSSRPTVPIKMSPWISSHLLQHIITIMFSCFSLQYLALAELKDSKAVWLLEFFTGLGPSLLLIQIQEVDRCIRVQTPELHQANSSRQDAKHGHTDDHDHHSHLSIPRKFLFQLRGPSWTSRDI